MADAPADSRLTIEAMIDAFACGDNARAENLLSDALDLGAPWDEVTTAAAQGVTRHRLGPQRPRPICAPRISATA